MTSTSSPTKDIVVLFELSYASTIIRMNDVQDQLVLALGTFESVPSLKITLPPYTGVFERKEIEVEFAVKDSPQFAEAITSGRAHAEVYSRAWQWIRDDGSDRLRMLFSGRLTLATRNPSGRQGILKLNLVTPKAETQRASGIISDSKCQWTFGDLKTCTKDLGPLTESGSITFINRNALTIIGLAAHPDRYWNKGNVVADGVSIPIKEWISGTTFLLTKLLPKEWEDTVTGFGSKSVSVIPGCDKLADTCLHTWDNLDNFLGIGIAIPTYNPFFENPF